MGTSGINPSTGQQIAVQPLTPQQAELVQSANNMDTDHLEFVITNPGGGAIPVGTKISFPVIAPYDGQIVGCTLLADVATSATVLPLKTTYALYAPGTHPVAADSVVGAGTVPTLNASTKYQDAVLTGWATEFLKGSVLAVQTAVTTAGATQILVSLKCIKNSLEEG